MEGKSAIVTGGSAGIGQAVVEALAAHKVAVTFSGTKDQGRDVERRVRDAGGTIRYAQGDMADESFCRQLVDEAMQLAGRVDFLVNNAFSFLAKGLTATRQDWLRMMEVGPMGYAAMAQLASARMREAGGGAIVNMSSISAHIAQPDRWTYNAAKGAVNQLTRCMALDLAPWHIRVNTVSPGWIWTREVDKAAGGDRATWGPVWGKYHMMRRLGETHEVAAATLFLLSDEASFITAAELPVDGGYLGMGSEGLGETSTFAGSK
ncbi:MAG: SDR family oxidoreductase [Phycisphaeraceae bacterium]|nr:SDR family oxidoreductase [Phycisphaeraceae bacterium]